MFNQSHVKNSKRTSLDSIDITLSQDHPRQEKFECDVVVEKLMLDRSWQMRRVLWTEEHLYFKRLEGENIIDLIPFDEIDEIVCASNFELDNWRNISVKKTSAQDQDSSSQATKNSIHSFAQKLRKQDAFQNIFGLPFCGIFADLSIAVRKSNTEDSRLYENPVLHIRTIPGGFNSGRAYCFRIRSETDRENMFATLTKNIKLAKRKDRARTHWNRFHKHVSAFYNCSQFRFVVSMLLFTVHYFAFGNIPLLINLTRF